MSTVELFFTCEMKYYLYRPPYLKRKYDTNQTRDYDLYTVY